MTFIYIYNLYVGEHLDERGLFRELGFESVRERDKEKSSEVKIGMMNEVIERVSEKRIIEAS